MSPKIFLEKNKETKNSRSEEKKKSNGSTASFFFTSVWEPYFGCNVIQKSSSDIYFSYPCAQQKSDLKSIYFKI